MRFGKTLPTNRGEHDRHREAGTSHPGSGVRRHKGGIIWHTKGSGKSIVMVLLAKWILENNPHARVVVITDRDELDKQIERVFTEAGEAITRTTSGGDLMRRLGQGTVSGGGRSREALDNANEELVGDHGPAFDLFPGKAQGLSLLSHQPGRLHSFWDTPRGGWRKQALGRGGGFLGFGGTGGDQALVPWERPRGGGGREPGAVRGG
ncbi:DEAD/DEAH box helicase family protein [Solidesulfovibrio sp.]|uniref:DEAD/DEAH box helicase family protein n=1 Tax=Solidesulfovibrio sp. TaxID=2910990 RepID=UPI00344BD99C